MTSRVSNLFKHPTGTLSIPKSHPSIKPCPVLSQLRWGNRLRDERNTVNISAYNSIFFFFYEKGKADVTMLSARVGDEPSRGAERRRPISIPRSLDIERTVPNSRVIPRGRVMQRIAAVRVLHCCFVVVVFK